MIHPIRANFTDILIHITDFSFDVFVEVISYTTKRPILVKAIAKGWGALRLGPQQLACQSIQVAAFLNFALKPSPVMSRARTAVKILSPTE
jgi:hypothetical protein